MGDFTFLSKGGIHHLSFDQTEDENFSKLIPNIKV